MDRVSELCLFDNNNNNKANHVLVNEYEPGQGIFVSECFYLISLLKHENYVHH